MTRKRERYPPPPPPPASSCRINKKRNLTVGSSVCRPPLHAICVCASHQIDFQPCFLLFSGSSTTFRWRNTPARPSPKESRAQRRFTWPSTRKFTECSTCTTTATTILRYGDLRCAFHSNQHISISFYIYSVCFIILLYFQVTIFINRSDFYHYHLKKKNNSLVLVEF